MVKFFHLYKDYWAGISLIGVIAFVIQEIPYIIMPMISPASNPIMSMPNELPWLEKAEGISGTLTMVLLMLLIRDGSGFFSAASQAEKLFLGLTVLMIVINFAGWALYYLGRQYGPLIFISQFAVVPLYYLFFGLWKGNYPLAACASVFFVFHTINGYLNFAVRH